MHSCSICRCGLQSDPISVSPHRQYPIPFSDVNFDGRRVHGDGVGRRDRKALVSEAIPLMVLRINTSTWQAVRRVGPRLVGGSLLE